ncbi:MAG: hypothetical protein ABIG84_06125 [archaeon]
MHPIYDPKTLKKATEAYFQEDWNEMLKINLSMLDERPGDEFLLWHIADTYIKLGNVGKAVEFAEMIKESDVHRDDIMIKAAHLLPAEPLDKD